MELNVELKLAIWKIANLAMDCHDNKIQGEEFEQAAFKALKQVENNGVLPVVSDLLIAWEQYKKANWWESEAIDVEKKLMNDFQAIYGH